MSFWKILILLFITGVFTIIFVTIPIYKVTNEIISVTKEIQVVKTDLQALNIKLNQSHLLKI